jgi:hypothetical protein
VALPLIQACRLATTTRLESSRTTCDPVPQVSNVGQRSPASISPALANAHAEAPRRLTDRKAAVLAILSDQVAEHRHDATLPSGTVCRAMADESLNLTEIGRYLNVSKDRGGDRSPLTIRRSSAPLEPTWMQKPSTPSPCFG